MSFAHKKLISKQLRDVGVIKLEAEAVTLLAERVAELGPDLLNEFICSWKSDGSQGDRLTLDSVETVLAQLSGGRQAFQIFDVLNAFDTPKISYDSVGRKLYQDTQERCLFAPGQAKNQLYIDRLHLINQRIRRNSLFQQRTLDRGAPATQLTDIQSLKGVVGACRFVIGCISRSEDGRYILEDHSGTVPLNLSAAQTAAGFYTENCIVIVEGEMHVDGVFYAAAMGFPPTEARDNLPMAAQRLNFFGGAPLSSDDAANLAVEELEHDGDRMVVLANVHLDSREVLDGLRTLFAGYLDMPQLPTLFILMGNFHSKAGVCGRSASAATGAGVEYTTMRDLFNTLATLIDQYPRIKAESRFVFVPGPGDTGPSQALPQPPLPAFYTGELQRVLPNAIFASNPCRVRYLSQQIVLFRYDILKRMRRRCLIPPKDSNNWLGAGATQASGGSTQANDKAMWGHLALTLLQQSHLCPLPLLQQPILWQYDHAMSLYPLPNAVIIADSSPQAKYIHEGCTVFNPGSFSEGMFSVYKPCTQEVEPSEISCEAEYEAEPEEEEEEEELMDVARKSRKVAESGRKVADTGSPEAAAADDCQDLDQDVDLEDHLDSDLEEALGHVQQQRQQEQSPGLSDQGGDGAGPDDEGAAAAAAGASEAAEEPMCGEAGEDDDTEEEVQEGQPQEGNKAQETAGAHSRETADQDMWDAIVADNV